MSDNPESLRQFIRKHKLEAMSVVYQFGLNPEPTESPVCGASAPPTDSNWYTTAMSIAAQFDLRGRYLVPLAGSGCFGFGANAYFGEDFVRFLAHSHRIECQCFAEATEG